MRDGTGARRAAGPGGGQSLATERPPNAARGERDHEGEDGEEGDGDHDRHDEARGPGGVVGALERGLLSRRAEDAAEAVDDELDAQQERDHGQRQWRGPEVAAQAAVEHARGDEAARQSRIVETLHAGQPGPVVGGRGIHGRIAVGTQRAGSHQHGARARTRFAVEVDAVAHRRAVALQGLHECGVTLGGRQDDDHLGVGAGGERLERVGEGRVPLDHGGGLVGGTRCHQAPAHDHDAGPLPLVESLGDVAAGGPRTVGGLGGSSRSPMTSTLRPSATGTVRCGGGGGPWSAVGSAVASTAAWSAPTPVSASDPIHCPSCHLRRLWPLRNWADSPP